MQSDTASPRTAGTVADGVYEEVRERIVTLRMPPGSPISEEHVRRELGVGRTPLREAIKRLSLEDLVTIYPRRGTFVSDIDITDLSYISDVRCQLESHAAYRAAERATPLDIEHARDVIRDLERMAGVAGRKAFMDADTYVHRFVYSCSKNPYLASSAERFLNLSRRIWYVVFDQLPNLEERVLEQTALLQAIIDRDADTARNLAWSHVATFETEIRRIL